LKSGREKVWWSNKLKKWTPIMNFVGRASLGRQEKGEKAGGTALPGEGKGRKIKRWGQGENWFRQKKQSLFVLGGGVLKEKNKGGKGK